MGGGGGLLLKLELYSSLAADGSHKDLPVKCKTCGCAMSVCVSFVKN